MKNLGINNILSDEGTVSLDIIRNVEWAYSVKLPEKYINFIKKHNGAYLRADAFDYEDLNKNNSQNSNGITFVKVEDVNEIIGDIKSGEEPDWDIKFRFEDGLIPFGDNGGGDLICFDYRKNKTTDNPPIVIWNHDMGLEHRVVFIANSFEEFINMLYEPDDED